MDNIKRVRAWQEEHKKLGLCIECNNETFGKLRCKECNKRRILSHKNKGIKWKEQGLCLVCGKEVLEGKKKCLTHYLKEVSSGRLGTQSYDKQLKELMEKQNYKCALTGDDINWLDDIELDHIMPKSKGGSNILENVQWTTKEANRLKQDMTIDELRIICNKILNNLAERM